MPHIRSTAKINHPLLVGNLVGGTVLILNDNTFLLRADMLQQSIHAGTNHIPATILPKIRIGGQIRILMHNTGLCWHTGNRSSHDNG